MWSGLDESRIERIQTQKWFPTVDCRSPTFTSCWGRKCGADRLTWDHEHIQGEIQQPAGRKWLVSLDKQRQEGAAVQVISDSEENASSSATIYHPCNPASGKKPSSGCGQVEPCSLWIPGKEDRHKAGVGGVRGVEPGAKLPACKRTHFCGCNPLRPAAWLSTLVPKASRTWLEHKTTASGPLWMRFQEMMNLWWFYMNTHDWIWFVRCFEELLWLCNWDFFFFPLGSNCSSHNHCGCLATGNSRPVTGILKLRNGDSWCLSHGRGTSVGLTWDGRML